MAVESTHSQSDGAIVADLGARLRALRLRRNVTQAQLSHATLVSLNTIKSLETGKGKLATLVAVLRALDALAYLEDFIPGQQISPLQLAKMSGKKRQRASGSRTK